MSGNDPLGPVTIGAREIYDAVIMLTGAVGELRGDLTRQGDTQANHGRRLDAYSERLRAVERRVWAIPSIAVVLAALGVAVSLIKAL